MRLWIWFWDILTAFLTGHSHDWNNWEDHGITFQQRKCKTCRYSQIIGKI